jgi:hypothetical protein
MAHLIEGRDEIWPRASTGQTASCGAKWAPRSSHGRRSADAESLHLREGASGVVSAPEEHRWKHPNDETFMRRVTVETVGSNS